MGHLSTVPDGKSANELLELGWKTLVPFLVVALIYAALCMGYFFYSQAPQAPQRFFPLWALSMADLLILAQAVRAVLRLSLANPPSQRATLGIQVAFWGMLKIVCLGIFGYIFFQFEGMSGLPMLLGLSTLLVVPLVGGYFWSKNYA